MLPLSQQVTQCSPQLPDPIKRKDNKAIKKKKNYFYSELFSKAFESLNKFIFSLTFIHMHISFPQRVGNKLVIVPIFEILLYFS